MLAGLALFDQGHLGLIEEDGGGQDAGRRLPVLNQRLVEVGGELEAERRIAEAHVVEGDHVQPLCLRIDRVGEELHLADAERIEDRPDGAPARHAAGGRILRLDVAREDDAVVDVDPVEVHREP